MISVTEMTQAEHDEALAACISVFGEEYAAEARKDFAASLVSHPYSPKTFLAREGGALAGLLQSAPCHVSLEMCGFAWVCVLPAFRGRDIGRKLLAHAEEDAVQRYFKGKDGTFILSTMVGPGYYRALGYAEAGPTHDGGPLMVKIFKAA
jgi:GNAT superfamily N-acetyltransferase